MTNSHFLVRAQSMTSLVRIHAKPELVVPALTNALSDPNRTVHFFACGSLALFQRNAQHHDYNGNDLFHSYASSMMRVSKRRRPARSCCDGCMIPKTLQNLSPSRAARISQLRSGGSPSSSVP